MKRLLSIVLVLAMLAMLTVTFPAQAAGEVTFTVGTSSGARGSSVQIPISVSGNPGISMIRVDITLGTGLEWDYDSLNYTNNQSTWPFISSNDVLPLSTTRPTGASFTATTASLLFPGTGENVTDNGKLVTLKLKIAEAADFGDVSVDVSIATCVNQTDADVPYNPITNGKVTVACATHTPPVDWNDGTAATCTEASTRVKKCTVCGYVLETDTTPALGHLLTIYDTDTATCTAAGVRTGTCDRCFTTGVSETSPAKGHTPPATWNAGTPATCTAASTQKKLCTVCGSEMEAETVPALGHDVSEFLSWADFIAEYPSLEADAKAKLASYDYDIDAGDNKFVFLFSACDRCGEIEILFTFWNEEGTVNVVGEMGCFGTFKLVVDTKDSVNDVSAALLKKIQEEFGNASKFIGLYDITIQDAQGNVYDAEQLAAIAFTGSFQISIKLPAGYENGENVYVVYVNENGEYEVIEATVIDGFAVFEVSHFSQYGLVFAAEGGGGGGGGGLGDHSVIGLWIVLAVLSANGMIALVINRKKLFACK